MGKIYHLIKEIARLIANHSIGNTLRKTFLRISGVKIGKKVFTNQGLVIVDNGKRNMVILEDYVTLAPRVTIVTRSSPYHIHPSLRKEDLPIKEARVVIGEGTWIGTNVTILPGVKIGKCCVIGANSLVTKDIPEYSIAIGIPAKPIKNLKDENNKLRQRK
ncbi:MAG: acyltransferase [Candidatus Nanoarchaeia archaeon]|nr:acyltransferase [Candidatus Nanoarchaeia archaeon]